ncbi:MAG TPA: carboxymuconolactone decarboxylase family protein [Methanomassiliicoccales archaeon]|nr:carboxymuconolactone decarboxylase family protein [Methanomassiliicoccales archaeon]
MEGPVNNNGEKDKETKVRQYLQHFEEHYGQVPFITNQISKRQDLFLGYAEFSNHLMFNPKFLDQKTMELAAISAGAALGAEHCLDVHLRQASKFGANDEEIFEAIMVGAYMAMTRSQSVALRRYKEFQDHK